MPMQMDYENLTFATPAAVQQRATSAELTTLLEQVPTVDMAAFENRAPFFWQCEISSNRVDAYFTSMQASTLKNFANDAAAGVSFQNSHNTMELGLGRSLTGQYVGAKGSTVDRVLADFYTVPGLRLNSVSTDDFITGVRTGLLRDVSVGFYGGRIVCNINGLDLFDWDNQFMPGVEYPITDPATGKKTTVLCIGLVEDARLAEVSIVYDGATPGAAILKAQQEATNGRITDTQRRMLEQRYRIRLPDKTIQARGVDIEPKDEPKEKVMQTADEALREIRDITTEYGAKDAGVELPHAVRTVLKSHQERATTALAEVERLNKRLNELTPLADDGKAYRADLLTAALEQGVRAMGEGFAAETYRTLLQTAPLDTVKRFRDDWKTAADKVLKGGRKIDGPGDKEPGDKDDKPNRNGVPDAAYRA